MDPVQTVEFAADVDMDTVSICDDVNDAHENNDVVIQCIDSFMSEYNFGHYTFTSKKTGTLENWEKIT